MKEPYYAKKKRPFYKKKQFLTVIIGGFFVVLMALSAVNIGQGNGDSTAQSTIEYNGVEFNLFQNGWQGQGLTGQTIYLTYGPDYLADEETISVPLEKLQTLQKVYLSVNPNQAIDAALRDFQLNVPMNGQVILSCFEDNDRCTDLPLKTCEDATNNVGVVLFKEAEDTSITFKENCLTIQGEDLLKVTDKMVLDYHAE